MTDSNIFYWFWDDKVVHDLREHLGQESIGPTTSILKVDSRVLRIVLFLVSMVLALPTWVFMSLVPFPETHPFSKGFSLARWAYGRTWLVVNFDLCFYLGVVAPVVIMWTKL